MSNLSRVVNESNAAFEPLLAKLSAPVKMELYKAIYSDAANAANMTEEVLTLGVALTSDPSIQRWLSMTFSR
jgi:hypothetical protein